ncbi:MAG TPA: hypothetical protein VFM93_12300 [Candidatus Limnocylindria bacterium]|nr:hypothetical protein [Candidatus Limnocylindria bacterium]
MRPLLAVSAAALGALVVLGALALAVGGDGPADRRTVAAPIDDMRVATQRSLPAQYLVSIRAGLPSGCAQRHSHTVERKGDLVVITILNSMPTGDVACTMIYGWYDLEVAIGSDFVRGATYTVRVNDRTVTFTAG